MALLACPAVLTEPHNCTAGGQRPASDDANLTIESAYNPDGNVSSITAVNPTSGNQTTQHVYGTTLADSEIATTYEVRGMRAKITSYDNPTVGSGSVVNEVQFSYNDFAQLVTDYQEHGGGVTVLTVDFAYGGCSLFCWDFVFAGRSFESEMDTAGGRNGTPPQKTLSSVVDFR